MEPTNTSHQRNSITRCQALLGTYVEINISASKSDDQLVEMSNKAFVRIKEIETLMSFHDKNSELSYLNKEAFKGPCSISPEMKEVLSQALSLSAKTDGIYDISIAPKLMEQDLLPHHDPYSDINDFKGSWKDINLKDNIVEFNKDIQIDLGGIAKGYAIDQALSLIEDSDSNISINAGGDLVMSDWQSKTARIKFSNKGDHIDIDMHRKALASSACYYLNGKSAIISPLTQKPVLSDDTISVFANNCMLADALTKVVFLQGEKALNLLEETGAIAFKTDKNGFSKIISKNVL